jgi:hypothetical protein
MPDTGERAVLRCHHERANLFFVPSGTSLGRFKTCQLLRGRSFNWCRSEVIGLAASVVGRHQMSRQLPRDRVLTLGQVGKERYGAKGG